MQPNPQTATVIPFPKGVAKGRKRVARGLTTGAGDLTLLVYAAQALHVPSNVVSLKALATDAAEAEGISDGALALQLAHAIYWGLDEPRKEGVRRHLQGCEADLKSPRHRASARVMRDLLGPRFYVEYPNGARQPIEGSPL